MGNAEYMGITTTVMKNTSRTQSAKAGKRKPWFRGKYSAAAPKEIVKAEATKAPRFYLTEDKKIKLTNNKANNKATKLKASLVPGAVVILLAGRFKGQRAVFLKQLPSGLCLITGPYKVNGIPLRRVPQSYVIGTSTVVDVSKADTTAVTDCQLKKPKSAKKKPLDDAAKAPQEKVDGPVVKAIEAESMLKDYMRARFSLKNGQYPHEMSF